MGLERKFNRRYVEKSGQLKENKITIEKNRYPKNKKNNDVDITVESPEFQLLVKLFVPSKLLIHNNKVSRKQLSTYLPPIIESDSFSSLNFELHIFLSSIVTSYVTSWYFLKLNTEDFEFVESVYNVLCAFIRNFSRRVSSVVELTRLLNLLNRCAFILDDHIERTKLDDGLPRFIRQDLMKREASISSRDELSTERIIDDHLQKSHVIFLTDKRTEPGTSDERRTNRLKYLRLVVKNIMSASFKAEDLDVSKTPISSTIAMNLVTSVLADLVLDRLLYKMSSPQFLLQTVIGKIGTKIRAAMLSRSIPYKNSMYKRLTSSVSSIYLNACALWTFGIDDKKAELDQVPPILFSPVLSLINHITNLSLRKPIWTGFLSIFRSAISASSLLTEKVERFVAKYLMNQIRHGDFLQDETQASLVAMIREIVFDNGEVKEETNLNEGENLSELTGLWYDLLCSKESSSRLPMGVSLWWLRYRNESAQELKRDVEDFLRIFDLANKDPKGPYSEESKINQLLVIRLFDSVIQSLYPELVEKIDIMS